MSQPSQTCIFIDNSLKYSVFAADVNSQPATLKWYLKHITRKALMMLASDSVTAPLTEVKGCCLYLTMWLMAMIADTNFLKAEVVTGNKVNYVHADRPTP